MPMVKVTLVEDFGDGIEAGLAGRLSDAAAVVGDFLAAMEARDLTKAQAMLADDFTMVFPGTGPMRELPELVAWAKHRYAAVAKSYERFDVAPVTGGVAVYCFGTLYGEWLDGRAFEGIRFIDRFTVAGGKILDQRVWNDMGETLLCEAAG